MGFMKIAGEAAIASVALATAISVAAASPAHRHRNYQSRRVNPAPVIGAMIGAFVGVAVGATAMNQYG